MNKFKYLVVFGFVLSLGAAVAQADVGDGKVLACQGANSSFNIYQTAITTLFQGQLDLGKRGRYMLQCTPNTSHYGGVLFQCVERRSGEGQLMVRVIESSLTRMTLAEVSQAMYPPLHPKHLITISCR